MSRRPNFFILGAPKCGTTSLSEYFRTHPDVLFSTPKEPAFFSEDLSYRVVKSLEDYLDCFSGGSGTETAIGEGSPIYLFSKTAVPNILQFNPLAKFFVMLRNPVDAAASLHSQALYSNQEDLLDFEEAWCAQNDRLEGRRMPAHNRYHEFLQYGLIFSYADQIERLFRHAPRDRVHFILFEEFKADPEKSFQEALDFLGLPRISLIQYPVSNAGKRPRSAVLQRLIFRGSKRVAKIKSSLGIQKELGIFSAVLRLNTNRMERSSLSPVFRAELIEYFRDDIERTAGLIGRDLSGWSD